jgi:23S rRNA (guanosine2251-2'-O)-methyltransferase
MGAEDVGVSPEILRICDDIVSIPIVGNIESLNVSVASAIMIYEVLRQRNL